MRKLSIVGLSVLAVFAIACGASVDKPTTQGPGVDTSSAGGASAAGGADQGKHAIHFEVTGTGVTKAGNVTYGVGANSSQANDVALPWSKDATSTDSFLIVSLVAQSGSGKAGKINCKVTVDGKVVVENSSEGPYAVVTCAGSL